MVRWEPGAKERLQSAAVGLFLERGYDRTTVQDIAAAAGLTERTFFRHFADKREVLFGGGAEYLAGFVEGVRSAPEGSTPFELVVASLTASADFFSLERRPWSRQRQSVIDAHPALRERELLKRAAQGDAIAGALRERGVPDPDALLAADAGVAVFTAAFRAWLAPGEERSLLAIEQEVLARMVALLPPAGGDVGTGPAYLPPVS